MFTGIITDVGEVVASEPMGEGRRFVIACHYEAAGIDIGASICCAGACLTVVKLAQNPAAPQQAPTLFYVDASAETLRRTVLGAWQVGTRINLERALKIGDELGGHIVTGHVDGVAQIVLRTDQDGCALFHVRAPHELACFIAQKGSVTLNGTSLTVNDVKGDVFSLMLIPHTLSVTTWRDADAGTLLNIEVDMMARYAARLVEARS